MNPKGFKSASKEISFILYIKASNIRKSLSDQLLPYLTEILYNLIG